MFHCLSNSWSKVPDHVNLPLPLASMEMELINNNVYIAGGYTGADGAERFTDNLFALDLGDLGKGWEELSCMSTKRSLFATVNFNSK